MHRHSLWILVGLLILVSCAQESAKVTRNETDGTAAPNTAGNTMDKGRVETPPGSPDSASPPVSEAPKPLDPAIPVGPTTPSLSVTAGTMNFDLGAAKSTLTGALLSMNISVSAATGTVPASVYLSNLSVKAPVSTGLVLYRPVLVLVADGKETQFPMGTNINLKVPKARSVPLAGLTGMNAEGIKAGASIKMRFSALEPLADALLDGIPNYRECKAPQSFQAVSAALQPCKSCHSGLFAYEFIDKDMATACGQNLKIIDKTLNGTAVLPAIPTGTHHAINAAPARSAIDTWKAAEGL